MTNTIESRQGIAPCRAAPPRSDSMRPMRIPRARTGRLASRTSRAVRRVRVGIGFRGRAFLTEGDS